MIHQPLPVPEKRQNEHVIEDVAEASDFLATMYPANLVIHRMSPGTALRHVREHIGDLVTVDDVHASMTVSCERTGMGPLTITDVVSGCVDHFMSGRHIRLGPRDVYAEGRLPSVRTTTLRGARLRVVSIDQALVRHVLDLTGDGDERQWCFDGMIAATPQWIHQWTATLDHVLDNLRHAPAAARHPLIAGHSARLLAAIGLTAFPVISVALPPPARGESRRAETVRRAITFMNDAPLESTLVEVAAAAGVSVRTLQYAFRNELQTTPLAYRRRLRLDAAHRDLKDADPSASTVTAIAARWGFLHPGRFSTQYRSVYGVPPGLTLRG
ncbi:helix-turn-helix transcriptional regulator [Streptomyces sp. NPDC090303]|uniref:helix-turn-helix transcriptional regulator n=1 Tax=Streptomyces sp. NPDC090303 TaxID=3365960 RepID=UPI0037FDCD87